MKRLIHLLIITSLFVGFGINHPVQADSGEGTVINEKFGPPIVAYGGSLTTEQQEQVKQLLDVHGDSEVSEITVTGADIKKYIDGDSNSRMFSSAKITRTDKGEGLVINQLTPENITEVTNEMYANALLTAGIEDAQVNVASPVKVTGHSALTGIYKAYEVSGGEELNGERLEIANEELGIVTELAKQEGLDGETANELITQIKKQIAEQSPITKEEVQEIVEEELNKINIELSDEDRQLLINLFDKMRALDIDFEQVKNQLEELTSGISKKIEEISEDEGFWQKIVDFFNGFIEAIRSVLK
ncbi:DUF1002 domain-containing protein [Bacillus solimangrovi]|uniref:DUF1002 domain-containing protein n=1 Tax=Bacillus solimangrovi TaxID=1305675 RepID=A0A1E5LET2_9BACI|nr:DUF1002 domain-containing protein [Bacillus solimangrovi]OEH92584.1 hypothetical protein BFG57_14975 [Bacillus solimangrovi]